MKRIRVFIYLITGLLLPALFQESYNYFTSESFESPLLNSILVCGGCIALALLIEFFLFIYRRLKRPSVKSVLERIDNIGNDYKLPNGDSMFSVNADDYFLKATEEVMYAFQRFIKNSKHILYHSLSVKKHLNWIEFVFWSFLREVKDQIKCDITVSFHLDEDSQTQGMHAKKDWENYYIKFECISKIAKKILGKDIKIIDETKAQRRRSKILSTKFHSIFVNKLVASIKEISENNMSMVQFKRRVSFVESVYPLILMALRRGQKYILDRTHAHAIWNEPPLDKYKNRYNIYFINATTLTYPDGVPIRIFKPDDTVNITDSLDVVKEKLVKLDSYTKKIMFCLLGTKNQINFQSMSDDLIESKIIDFIKDAKNKYNL